MPVLYGTKSIWKKERTVSITKVVWKTKHAFASRQRVLMLIRILHCICSNVPKNILIIICLHPPLSHTPPLATAPCCFHSAAGQRSQLRSKYRADHGSCQKIKIPAWYCLEDEVVMLFDSYFTFESRFRWHRLILTVESTREIPTLVVVRSPSLVVYELLEGNVRMGIAEMVSLTNNFKFCRLNWK